MTLLNGLMLGADFGPQGPTSIVVRADFKNLDQRLSKKWLGDKLALRITVSSTPERPLRGTIFALEPADVAEQAIINFDETFEDDTRYVVVDVALNELAEDGEYRAIRGVYSAEEGTPLSEIQRVGLEDLYHELDVASSRLLTLQEVGTLVSGGSADVGDIERVFARDWRKPIVVRVAPEHQSLLSVWLDRLIEAGIVS